MQFKREVVLGILLVWGQPQEGRRQEQRETKTGVATQF